MTQPSIRSKVSWNWRGDSVERSARSSGRRCEAQRSSVDPKPRRALAIAARRETRSDYLAKSKEVGTTELESVTSCMSSKRSNQLSYAPVRGAAGGPAAETFNIAIRLLAASGVLGAESSKVRWTSALRPTKLARSSSDQARDELQCGNSSLYLGHFYVGSLARRTSIGFYAR